MTRLDNAALVLFAVATTAVAISAPASAQTAAQTPSAVALADSLSGLVYRASMTRDVALLASTRALATRALAAHPAHPLLEHHLAETYYREATLLTEQDDTQPLLERAQEILDRAVERPGAIAETHALRGSVIGMRITNMLKGITMGPRAEAAVETAMKLDPTSPQPWLVMGVSTLHKPGFVGGGADNAIEDLERGVTLAASFVRKPGHPASALPELWAWIGVAHMREDRPAEAISAFRQALAVEPGFGWVREVLLPGAERAARR